MSAISTFADNTC